MSDSFNIYMAGVGGQGIGLLSQSLLTAIDLAGIKAVAVDTHGLAQRGGVVVSRIRCGNDVYSPLIMKGEAHLILALEVHEAMRAVSANLYNCDYDSKEDNGFVATQQMTLCFLDVVWQPLTVRLGEENAVTAKKVEATCDRYRIAHHRVISKEIQDPRMQNMALIGTIAGHDLIPGVQPSHYRKAIKTLFKGVIQDKNMELFDQYAST